MKIKSKLNRTISELKRGKLRDDDRSTGSYSYTFSM